MKLVRRSENQRSGIVGIGRPHRGRGLRGRGQDSARTRFGGRVRRFASVGPVGIEYFGCPSDFGSEAGRWLLCFGQAAAGFLQSWQELLGKHSNWEQDVFDFSCHIEGCMAALAAERRTDADLKRIRFWLEKFEEACGSGNLEHQGEADVSFHQTIADAAHNLLFSHLSGGLLKMLYRQTRSSLIYLNQEEDPRPKLMAQHRVLYEAISNRLPGEASEAAKAHLNYVASSILKDREYQSRNRHADTLAQNDLKRVQDWEV